METKLTNEEKAKELVQSKPFTTSISPIYKGYAFDCAIEMAKWKDEQYKEREEGLQGTINAIDARLQKSNESGLHYFDKYNNEKCKLEEQQANYEELKKRYDEAVERERIVIKIIVDIAKDHNVDDKTIQGFLNGIGIKKHKQ